jgi:hypothetical protein
MGTHSLLYNGYRIFPGGKEQPERDADPLPPSSAMGKGRVEVYLYSPYGLYGLYRVSLPVQRCTLPWDPIVFVLTECTSTVFCIRLDDGSVSRNMSP